MMGIGRDALGGGVLYVHIYLRLTQLELWHQQTMAEVNGAHINNNHVPCLRHGRDTRGFVAILDSQFADQLIFPVNSREIKLVRVKLLAHAGHILRWPAIG